MNNEKSVYERILEDKDKIINFQQDIINKLLKGVIALSIISIISVALGIGIPFYNHIYGYFWSSYADYSDNSIKGDNNTSASGNTLQEESVLDINSSKEDK